MSLHGHVFNKQLFSSECFALFIDTFLAKNSGIVKGCEITNTTNSISIGSGYFCIQGRFLEEQGGTTFDIATVTSTRYCKLICEIDLSKENTTSELKQAYYKILESTSDYPVLQQDDITEENAIYQFEFAQFKVTENGIENFADTRTFLDFDSIYEEIRTNINAFLATQKITTQSQIDALMADLQEYIDTAEDALDGDVAMNLLNLINTKANKKKVYNITIDTEWTGTEAPYTKTIEVEGMTADDIPHLELIQSATVETAISEQENFNKISKIVSSAGSITLTCYEEKTEIALNARIEVMN